MHVEGLSERLEGRSRAGHFRGVSTVVLKLLEIAQPHFAYFGRKDAQQVRIVQQMVRDLNMDTEIVVCPIVREPDGLAMSSRNAYLKGEDRKAATVLYRALRAAESEIASGARDSLELQRAISKVLASEPRARVDYAEIVGAETFEPVLRVTRRCYAALGVYLGKTRLIDNIVRGRVAGGSLGGISSRFVILAWRGPASELSFFSHPTRMGEEPQRKNPAQFKVGILQASSSDAFRMTSLRHPAFRPIPGDGQGLRRRGFWP